MRVSIVIPVYNEATHLPACLAAIAAQTVRPYEVILVDNNSSDDSAAIAERYSFVKLLRQPHQGVVFARDMGFSAARGEIIGRIDADTVLSANWVQTVLGIFADPTIDAVSGRAQFYDQAFAKYYSWADLCCRRWFARVTGKEVALHGANMALRRTSWQKVRADVCHTAGIHEDFDLSAHLALVGCGLRFDETMVAGIANRRVASSFIDYSRYMLISPRTYGRHDLKSRRYMYPLVWISILAYIPLKLLQRGYDIKRGRFVWGNLLRSRPEASRVNPATHL